MGNGVKFQVLDSDDLAAPADADSGGLHGGGVAISVQISHFLLECALPVLLIGSTLVRS